MYWYSDMQTLLDDLQELLTETFCLKGFKIILRDETTRAFSIIRASPPVAIRELEHLRIPSPVFQYFEWGRDAYLSLGDVLSMGSKSVLARQAREQLQGLDAQFCFALSSQNEPFGLLLVDQKISGEPYTATDINLLVMLVKNLSLMVNQIRLKTQILHAQELDLLGRMSRGMAHDLNNLLTPVWTLLQLSSEEGSNTFDEDLLPVALRNIKTMRAYIREALFFSENLRPDIQLGRLDMLLMQAAELAKASRKKQVEVITDVPEEVVAELDEVLLQRMVANLISNAIDASAEGSEVRVELTRLAKTEASRDWVRVRISDRGEGIRKEDLNRVFTPYFTTKNRGDENRGFGLGLAICRKIVNLHGGNLSIASQLKKGTTVQVDLPTRQIKQVQPTAVASA
jgi:signal transduction histidine kinase